MWLDWDRGGMDRDRLWLDLGKVWLDGGRVWGHVCIRVEFRGLQVEAIDRIIFCNREIFIKKTHSQPLSSGTSIATRHQVITG